MPVGNSNGKFFEDDFEAALDEIQNPVIKPPVGDESMEITPPTIEALDFNQELQRIEGTPVSGSQSPENPLLHRVADAGERDSSAVQVQPGFLIGTGPGRHITWPEKMARDGLEATVNAKEALTSGLIDPSTPEGVAAVTQITKSLVFGIPAWIGAKVSNGTLGSFAGVGSKTIDNEKLNAARALDRKAETPRKIWEETGFFKGTDGQWRYELDSSQMKFNMPPKEVFDPKLDKKVEGPIEQFLDYPDFFKAYPEAKKLTVELDTELPTVGVYRPKTERIIINPNRMEFFDGTYEGVFAHELQHIIQRQEGWSGGSNPMAATHEWDAAIGDKIMALRGKDPKLEAELTKLRDELHELDTPRPIMNGDGTTHVSKMWGDFGEYMYRRNPGEIEAEVVRHRQDTPLGDRTTIPAEHAKILEHYGLLPKGGEFRYPHEIRENRGDLSSAMVGPARTASPEALSKTLSARNTKRWWEEWDNLTPEQRSKIEQEFEQVGKRRTENNLKRGKPLKRLDDDEYLP
jgi:hypothetical protein